MKYCFSIKPEEVLASTDGALQWLFYIEAYRRDIVKGVKLKFPNQKAQRTEFFFLSIFAEWSRKNDASVSKHLKLFN